ncbi:MAG: ATP-binding protein, partial [Gammaproteobacteria bacterium]|nr:ATP-binding protein [Gammaproteobacteria bacterium]
MSNVNTLKAQLREALEQDKYGQVLNLSSELARQDMDHVRFSIDASHLNRIGRELVTKQETAVAELVKNGYDADATRVTLLFQDSNRVGGTLVIADNGLGMTRQQLIDGFMRLSTSDKAERPLSEKYKRRRAGRKGIGRFSAQRLGRQLILKTQTENSDHALQLSINWDAFEANSELTTISSRVEVIDKENRQGTTLSIKNLRDIWSEAQIRRSYRYISELLQPFPISKKKQNDDSDPGFESVFYLQLADNRQLVADKKSAVFQYALAEIEGHVDDKGRAFWSMQSQRYNIDEKNQQVRLSEKTSDERFKFLNNACFKAYYYLNVYDLLPRNERARIVNRLNEQGGIRLYRNGFRVLPYGEPYNNWLGL